MTTVDIDLPGELTDMVIEHLHNDVNSLKLCSLVCQQWLPACRHHLFESVICYQIQPDGRSLQDLLYFLSSRNRIGPFVRNL
ncbi:uncharacterized protein BXZ73DRAFT_49211, partial [Epithele typhae]|uniref:uncharacterized protein n=1 Tax=Epithele typhae TaxID=378194 RepID=UPI0020086AAD